MAGGGSGLSLPHPALPPRSETWAAGQQPSAALRSIHTSYMLDPC